MRRSLALALALLATACSKPGTHTVASKTAELTVQAPSATSSKPGGEFVHNMRVKEDEFATRIDSVKEHAGFVKKNDKKSLIEKIQEVEKEHEKFQSLLGQITSDEASAKVNPDLIATRDQLDSRLRNLENQVKDRKRKVP